MSDSQRSQRGPVSLKELRHITSLAGLGLLHKVGWALGNKSADLHCHALRRSICSAKGGSLELLGSTLPIERFVDVCLSTRF